MSGEKNCEQNPLLFQLGNIQTKWKRKMQPKLLEKNLIHSFSLAKMVPDIDSF